MTHTLGNLHFALEEATILMVTVFLSFVVLNSKGTLLNRRARKDMRQAQRAHESATPRLGGAVIFAAVAMISVFADGFFGERYTKFALAMLPMICVTLWEDMLRPTSPRTRLAATLASCLLTVMSLRIWFTSLDVPVIDPWLAGLAGVVVTVAFVTASVNAFNMVDGVNGLCGGMAMAALVSLHMIATAVGHDFVAHVALTLAVAAAAFLLFNFPKARLFLGDTGSYVFGFIISWFGISICFRFPEVSPWAIFLIMAYPLSELAATVTRRLLSGHSPFRADARHMHHLVLLLLRQVTSHGQPLSWQNPTSTLVILPFAVAPMVAAVVFFDRPGVLQGLTIAYGVAFACAYAGLHVLTGQPGRMSRPGTAEPPPASAPVLRIVDAAGRAGQDKAA